MTIAIFLTAQDLDTAVRTVVGEASDQGLDGMTGVAWTIRNRAQWSPAAWWGDSISGVCLKFEQYSCWLPGPDHDRIVGMLPMSTEYLIAKDVVSRVMDGSLEDPTGGATTYKRRGTKASWDAAVASLPPRSIGAHDFWRLSPSGPVLAFLDEPQTEEVA